MHSSRPVAITVQQSVPQSCHVSGVLTFPCTCADIYLASGYRQYSSILQWAQNSEDGMRAHRPSLESEFDVICSFDAELESPIQSSPVALGGPDSSPPSFPVDKPTSHLATGTPEDSPNDVMGRSIGVGVDTEYLQEPEPSGSRRSSYGLMVRKDGSREDSETYDPLRARTSSTGTQTWACLSSLARHSSAHTAGADWPVCIVVNVWMRAEGGGGGVGLGWVGLSRLENAADP